MAIQTLWDTGSSYSITPGMDGGVYGTGIADAVCKGIGDEFTLQYSSDSLTVQFNAGSQCVIGGAFFKVMSLEAITLTANATIYLCANINKSNANGSRGSFVQRTSSNMQSQNLNGSGSSRDLLLYVITTSANGVSNVSDRRVIKGDGGSSVSSLNLAMNTDPAAPLLKVSKELANSAGTVEINFKIISEASYNALATKDSKTLYFIPEN